MPRKPVSPDHEWVGASTSHLDARSASVAVRNGWVKIDVDTVVNVLEVYCEKCRQSYDDAAGVPCTAAEGNDHLIGGPVRTRKRRAHDDHDCAVFNCQLSAGEAAALRVAASQETAARRGPRRRAV